MGLSIRILGSRFPRGRDGAPERIRQPLLRNPWDLRLWGAMASAPHGLPHQDHWIGHDRIASGLIHGLERLVPLTLTQGPLQNNALYQKLP